MAFLVFRLYAPLASWGEPAVGEERPSAAHPSASAVLGLLAAALGLRRDDEVALLALHHAYDVAVGTCSAGRLLRDYHTAQVPGQSALKKRPHRTRADELAIAKTDLNTILSNRDYREDGVWLVAVAPRAGVSQRYSLDYLRDKLARPEFTLYLGRKACPPALPLCPQVVEVATVREAFSAARFPGSADLPDGEYGQKAARRRAQRLEEKLGLVGTLQQVTWPDGMASGYQEGTRLETVRKDRLISRRRWQFGDRIERIWLAPEAEALRFGEA